ncbi:thioredoxin [Halopseudomonas phragmitis]|uniref:Thioredoxin n=2 Tax=Pseudomonadaceae TaxID=135621 RepID=A0A1V0B1L2_9GAMM|nr:MULTISPECIES: thioredoxin [Pseudomonadaceae]AQZ93822.1 thioredoxin [Halopseudomonas phragmitis]RHW19948.1 thioredoxin [Pseudomonas jilinensis]
MSQSPYIFDVTEADFDRFVLENSFHKPVLVDFWADWCAPCKALMPVLAKITESLGGELLLAKVNCDEQAGLTQRFGIRSLPTVVLFKDGQPVDGFAGVQPESAIRTLLEPHVGTPPEPSDTADPASQASELLEAGDPAAAIALLQPLISEKPDDPLLILLARALALDGQLDEAGQVLEAVKDRDSHKAALNGARAQLTFLRQAAGFPPRQALEQRLAAATNDSEALYQLAVSDLAAQRHEAGLQALLELFRQDRGYADGAAHKTLLQVFDLLGSDHPLTLQFRRKLYQLLY